MTSSASFWIHKYLKQFQDNPQSRVFAPLAEAYRKAGQPQEAVEVCKEGLLHHPQFIGGKVALARAYFDQKNYPKVIEVLRRVCEEVPDNIIAQKLLAESYLLMGNTPDALQAFKILMFFCPNDQELQRLVVEMETTLFQPEIPPPEPLVDPRVVKNQKARQIKQLTQFLQKLERRQHVLPVPGKGD